MERTTSFEQYFHQSIHIHKMAAIDYTPAFLLPNIYHYLPEYFAPAEQNQFLHLLGGGNLNAQSPFSFSFSSIDCGMLLYTESGAGRITTGKRAEYNVTNGQILYLDCNQAFSIHSVILPWRFKLFFISGKPLRKFSEILRRQNKRFFTLPAFSSIAPDLSSLLSISREPDYRDLLLMHKNLTEIFSSLAISVLPAKKAEAPNIPWYLIELKDQLENHYDQAFSLDYCEELFGINRYRLCREFSSTYGIPPLQFLTRQRIAKAKKILLTTDYSIYEISSMIGYENVSHFITQFKKYAGTTPGDFRQKAQESQAVLHCCVPQTSQPT